jgi:hypothetical protein
MSDLPKPLVCRDQAFLPTAVHAAREVRRSLKHELQHFQQWPRDLDVALIARLMKGDQDLIREAPRVAWVYGVTHGFLNRAPALSAPTPDHHRQRY